MEEILKYINDNIGSIDKIVFSSPRTKGVGRAKVSVRRVGGGWQIEEIINGKALHVNLELGALAARLSVLGLEIFRQHAVYGDGQCVTFLLSDSGKAAKRVSKCERAAESTAHNREKKYPIPQGSDAEVLRDLGVFTKQNTVSAPMYDKYRQINRFIEIFRDTVKGCEGKELNIVDFGCGKSYLSFALYHYLTGQGVKVNMVGYDLKEDVITSCRALAVKYGYAGMKFVCGDIASEGVPDGTDAVISLHACDTATDAALLNAIAARVKYIFCVPCCQHEINAKINGTGDFSILFRHGLIKERFSALLTDAVRMDILEQCGYKCDCIEFVDEGHTLKNIMIRANLKKYKAPDLKKIKALLDSYGCTHALLRLMEK